MKFRDIGNISVGIRIIEVDDKVYLREYFLNNTYKDRELTEEQLKKYNELKDIPF